MIVECDQSAMQDIFAVKRLVLSLRRHVGPEREVFNILTNRPSALLSPESQIYFRDIYDHVLRINDSIDTYRDLLSQRARQLSDAGLESARAGEQRAGRRRDAQPSVRRRQRHVGNELRSTFRCRTIRTHSG